MRDAFAKEMKSLVEGKDNVVLLSGDIGNRMFDGLKKSRPDQFINCGIAEANMMSMAAGMAPPAKHRLRWRADWCASWRTRSSYATNCRLARVRARYAA